MEIKNFTPHAHQLLALARKEADRFNHNYIGTEHLLLALTRFGQGVAYTVLQKSGLNLEDVRMEVEKQIGTGPETKMVGSVPYTPRVRKVLALAEKEAKRLEHKYVGTEHILLGILKEDESAGMRSAAARILKSFGLDIDQVRQAVIKEVGDSKKDPASAGQIVSEDVEAVGPLKDQLRQIHERPPHLPVVKWYNGVKDIDFINSVLAKASEQERLTICDQLWRLIQESLRKKGTGLHTHAITTYANGMHLIMWKKSPQEEGISQVVSHAYFTVHGEADAVARYKAFLIRTF